MFGLINSILFPSASKSASAAVTNDTTHPRKRARRQRRIIRPPTSTGGDLRENTKQQSALDHYQELQSLGKTLSRAATESTLDSGATLDLLDTSLKKASDLLVDTRWTDPDHVSLLSLIQYIREDESNGSQMSAVSKELRLGTIGQITQEYAHEKLKDLISTISALSKIDMKGGPTGDRGMS